MPVVGQQAIPQEADRVACLGLGHDALEGSKIAILVEPRQAGHRTIARMIEITPSRLADDVEAAAEDLLNSDNRSRLLVERNLRDPLGVGRVAGQDFGQNVGVESFHSCNSASRSL
jgi:hypothetical protein